MADPRRPGENVPELPRTPPPQPEAPRRTGAPRRREMPGIPRPEPELPAGTPRPEAPFEPNAPGQ